MITKITSTPFAFFTRQTSFFSTQNKNNISNLNYGLNTDTVSFSGNSANKLIAEVVDDAFLKLTENRAKTNNKLGIFGSRAGDVNLFIQEKVFGKEARLTLSNGDFNGRSFLNFDLKRVSNKPSEINSVDVEMPSEEAAKIIKLYL